MSLCSAKIGFGSSLKVSVSFVFLLLSIMVLLSQAMVSFNHEKEISSAATVEMLDRMKMIQWRNDRNWWIALFGFTVWAVVWRVQGWTQRYRLNTAASAKKSS
jgi:hypothetical protein